MDKRILEISLADAKEWYKGDNRTLKELALQAFDETELQEITCVKSWEEFCEKYNQLEHEYFIDLYSNIKSTAKYCKNVKEDRNLLATKEDAEAFLALMQLKRLRDQWYEALNWKPDFTNYKESKYGITLQRNKIVICYYTVFNNFLSFPNREIAEEFLKCFRELIEKVKEII